MSRSRLKKRRKIKLYSGFFITICLIAAITSILKFTLARYSSSANSNADVDIAFYLLKEQTLSDQIILEDVMPSEDAYIYNFSIANNDGTNRTEVALKYDIEIRMTTNLPLTYKLYVNEGTEDLFENYETEIDEDGTYFKKITSKENIFGFNENQKNTYRLEIKFPIEYNSSEYQGIAEALDIKINSKQIV